MPMPTRWTKEARQSILDMMSRGVSRREIEGLVDCDWSQIWGALKYHGRVDALERRRQLDPAYGHLKTTVRPAPVAAAPPRTNATPADQRAIDALYAPRVQVPERYLKYAGKSYG